MRKLFTSEAVTEGHPDKICDRISDAVLDAILAKRPRRALWPVSASPPPGWWWWEGRSPPTAMWTSRRWPVRPSARPATTTRAAGFDGNTCAIMTCLDGQSPDIDMGVTGALEVKEGRGKDTNSLLGAGDQGMMFGYALQRDRRPHAYAYHPGKRAGLQALPVPQKHGQSPYLPRWGKRRSQWNMGTMGSLSA